MAEAFRAVDVTRVREGVRQIGVDRAATEEPLESRGCTVSRSPSSCERRGPTASSPPGFCSPSASSARPDDLGTIEYCTDPSAEHPENIVNATLANGSAESLERTAGRSAPGDRPIRRAACAGG